MRNNLSNYLPKFLSGGSQARKNNSINMIDAQENDIAPISENAPNNKLYACATNTNKNTINQDFCLSVHNKKLNFSGIIIADGIGSHYKSEVASKFCCNKLRELLEKIELLEQVNFEQLYLEVKQALIEYIKSSDEFDFEKLDRNLSLGTTLICAIDCGSEYILAYSGNGSIWHIDGKFNTFGKNFYLPWNSINLLNPHSIEQEGKAALYRFISISDAQYNPTIIKLSKNQLSPGELIVIATDGVFSNDAVPIGKDANNTIWIKGEESMPILYNYLSSFLNANLKNVKNIDLEFALNQYLIELKEKSLMHDDTTLGVMISEKAVEYHSSLNTKNLLPAN